MVTDEERTYMWNFYAPEKRMRINLGIRRRLAPLLENDMQRIQVANAILLTFIGSPFLYYGDEIGMGDNIWLDDRDGVRTPMQWNSGPNGGFSSAPAEKLYAPLVDSNTFSYQDINVANQVKEQHSLLNWMKDVLHVRKRYSAFGRGDLTLLAPENTTILAYIRKYKDDTFLILNNLSPDLQSVNVDLSEYGCTKLLDLFTQQTVVQQTAPMWKINMERYAYHWYKLMWSS
jgi:maltose alpha-D-glucosyltransferase/alpha-amylase